MKTNVRRRDILNAAGKAAVVTAMTPVLDTALAQSTETLPLHAEAGGDRVVMLNGKTYLRGWVGYGERPKARAPWERDAQQADPDRLLHHSKRSLCWVGADAEAEGAGR